VTLLRQISARWTYHVVLFAINEAFIPELLYGDEYTDPVANFFDSNLLKDLLIAFKQIISIKIVHYPPCQREHLAVQKYQQIYL
jgi:hypothetical protein